MRIITVNLNGIRSAAQKGFFTWLAEQNADIVCVQETKAQMKLLDSQVFRPEGYHCYFSDAEKKGYSGVGIYTRKKPNNVITSLGYMTADSEGRYVEVDYGDLRVISLYLPSGTSGEERQAIKFQFLDFYYEILQKIRHGKQKVIICGDWNIAHKEIDLKNWRANRKNSGFLPEERAWLDKVFDELGLVDTFRAINNEAEQYTWWSHRGRAWEKNVGWRIDYQVVTPDLKDRINQAAIYKQQRFSDHAPLIIDYDLAW